MKNMQGMIQIAIEGGSPDLLALLLKQDEKIKQQNAIKRYTQSMIKLRAEMGTIETDSVISLNKKIMPFPSIDEVQKHLLLAGKFGFYYTLNSKLINSITVVELVIKHVSGHSETFKEYKGTHLKEQGIGILSNETVSLILAGFGFNIQYKQGMKAIIEACSLKNIPLDTLLTHLKLKGILSDNQTIKDIPASKVDAVISEIDLLAEVKR